jgi:undecaprenyl diphosphate synthase
METNKIPQSIGFIMDGNRRWAKAAGLPTLEGHRRGYDKMREVVDWCKELGVKEVIVYAFSTENWNRTQEEVGYLMNLFRMMIGKVTEDAVRDNARLIFLGERSRFDTDIVRAIEDAEAKTRACTAFTFGIALSYGGRAEIIDAIHRIPSDKLTTISEEEFSALLWTKELSDPDLIILSSGEERLSGFLPWQSIYSELFFTETHWPAFAREEFEHILAVYAARDRRRGK